jgi:hypothetical protein
MAIDLSCEQVMTLREVASILPRQRAGRKVHVSTLYRWASPRGVRGVRLETLKLGGRVVTSVEAVQRFAERCSATDSTADVHPPRSRQREFEQAEQELERTGI